MRHSSLYHLQAKQATHQSIDTTITNYIGNMKAIAQPCVRPVEIAMKKESMKVMKSKVDEQCAAEMQACFSKLKELVPSVPQDRKLSKTQLLQHVIDYILDLETALDFNPAVLSVPLPPVNRAPLSEKAEPNNIQFISPVSIQNLSSYK